MAARRNSRSRRKRRAAEETGQTVRVLATAPRPANDAAPVRKRAYEQRENGLIYLLGLQRLTRKQVIVGERYGRVFRISDIGDPVSIKSCLADSVGGLPPDPTVDGLAAIMAEAKAQLLLAREILGFESGLVGVCDVICGHQLRPREISPEQKVADELVTSLSNALNLLIAKRWGGGFETMIS